MRPRGDVALALLGAAREMATGSQAPTLVELAAQSQVGYDAARRGVDNLRRAGCLEIARTRVVEYRTRPVAEYVPVTVHGVADPQLLVLDDVFMGWAR